MKIAENYNAGKLKKFTILQPHKLAYANDKK